MADFLSRTSVHPGEMGTESGSIQQSVPEMGNTSGGPFCHQVKHKDQSIFLSQSFRRKHCSRRLVSVLGRRSPVRIPASSSDNEDTQEDTRRGSNRNPGGSFLAKKELVFSSIQNVNRETSLVTEQVGPSTTGPGVTQEPRLSSPICLDPERQTLRSRGLSEDVITTLQASRKPVTLAIYNKIWKRYCSFLGEVSVDVSNPDIPRILDFLQLGFDKGLRPSTLKSDVWALGCCVYEMATLKHAFNAKDMNSLVYRIIEGKLPPMPKDYSNELRDLIGTMLSRTPEKRPTANQILRKSYIKQHIKSFLDNSKLDQNVPGAHAPAILEDGGTQGEDGRTDTGRPENQSSAEKKTVDSSHSGVPKNGEQHEREIRTETAPGERKRHKVNKGKSPVKTKAACDPPALPELSHMNSTAAYISTLSKVDISVLPDDKRAPADEHLIPELQNDCRDPPGKMTPNCPKEQDIKRKPQAASKANKEDNVCPVANPTSMEDEEDDTMKLLQPACKGDHQANQEPLDSTEKLLQPFLPVAEPVNAVKEMLPFVTSPDGVAANAEIQPLNSSSEPSISRQRRHKAREDASSHSEQGRSVHDLEYESEESLTQDSSIGQETLDYVIEAVNKTLMVDEESVSTQDKKGLNASKRYFLITLSFRTLSKNTGNTRISVLRFKRPRKLNILSPRT
ncbi:unnamed protein product [Ranitomeya imitator]|uniref:non-specific serine/threonine protein kinase n=1 Tax=Ranitomeya imitator TaxID=111125 RepID=A0ABN9L464_9NEOB|nr:unnamed protein product [Ranitomeya imitator]